MELRKCGYYGDMAVWGDALGKARNGRRKGWDRRRVGIGRQGIIVNDMPICSNKTGYFWREREDALSELPALNLTTQSQHKSHTFGWCSLCVAFTTYWSFDMHVIRQ